MSYYSNKHSDDFHVIGYLNIRLKSNNIKVGAMKLYSNNDIHTLFAETRTADPAKLKALDEILTLDFVPFDASERPAVTAADLGLLSSDNVDDDDNIPF